MIAGIIAIVAIGIMLFPETRMMVLSLAPGPCEDHAYNANCYCDEGYMKVHNNNLVLMKYDCMETPPSPPSDNEYVEYAKTALLREFPNCDTIYCSQGMLDGFNTYTDVSYGTTNGVEEARIQCHSASNTDITHHVWWEVTVKRNDGTIYIPYPQAAPFCMSMDGTTYR